jgi:hypothetical protein
MLRRKYVIDCRDIVNWQHTRGGIGDGVIPIAEYGSEFGKASKGGKPRKPVRLLYSGKNHYDLLT